MEKYWHKLDRGSLIKDTVHHASAAAVAMVTATISPRQLGSEGRVDPRGTSGFLQPVSPSHLSCFSHLPQAYQLPPPS